MHVFNLCSHYFMPFFKTFGRNNGRWETPHVHLCHALHGLVYHQTKCVVVISRQLSTSDKTKTPDYTMFQNSSVCHTISSCWVFDLPYTAAIFGYFVCHSGVADQGGSSCFFYKGGLESILQLPGYHTTQPPCKSFLKGAAYEAPTD